MKATDEARWPPRRTWNAIAIASLIALLVLLAWPRRWYNDDCFITFRYGKHIAAGHGYVWNPGGERVEGGTSIAWTMLNAAAIRAGLDPVGFSRILALVASALGLVLVYRAAGPVAAGFALVAPLMLVAQRQWVLWSVSSHEMKLLTVVALAATARFVREVERGGSGWASGGLFLVATLFRPEAPLLHLAAGIGLAATTSVTRTQLATIARSGAIHGVGLATLCALRLAYFGQAFPNTFYAKVGAVQLGPGLSYLFEMTRQNLAWAWLVVIGVGLALGIARHGHVRAAVAQGLLWCSWLAFQGGGRWEFGFLDPLLPGTAITGATAVAAIHARRPTAGFLAALALVAAAATPLFRPFRPTAVLESAEHQRVVTDIIASDARALAPYLTPSDRISIGWAGVLPYLTGAWHFDPWGLNDREIATRPFDIDAPLFHQRHATWSDMVAREVMFVDVYNRFLALAPVRPRDIRAEANPWIEDGVPMYCVELPGAGKFRYWIFASPLPRAEIDAWLGERGLTLLWALPYEPWRAR